MSTRTYKHFSCENGHHGVEKTTENDQPYGGVYEYVTAIGMVKVGDNEVGYAAYKCDQCGATMLPARKPED